MRALGIPLSKSRLILFFEIVDSTESFIEICRNAIQSTRKPSGNENAYKSNGNGNSNGNETYQQRQHLKLDRNRNAFTQYSITSAG